MAADQPPRRRGRPRTQPDNLGSARGELAHWLRDVVARTPAVSNADVAATANLSSSTVGRALRGETFPLAVIVEAVVARDVLTPAERASYAAWVAKLHEHDKREGRSTTTPLPPRPWTSPEGKELDEDFSDPGCSARWRRRPIMIGAAGIVVALLIGGIIMYLALDRSPTIVKMEQVSNRSGAPTFTDPARGAGSSGARIPTAAFVEVSCKVYAPIFPSTQPDGYWYRIASPPWNNSYYAVANVFTNGDLPGQMPPTNTDWSVPDC